MDPFGEPFYNFHPRILPSRNAEVLSEVKRRGLLSRRSSL